MPKKRVYELAKEMGMENKELISRLEKLGIAVKSHSSTLEDSELERIQQALSSKEPTEMVEQRIKSTVIRRRAVRPPIEEIKEKPAIKEAEEEAPPDQTELKKAKKPQKEVPASEGITSKAKEAKETEPLIEPAKAPPAKELPQKEPAETVPVEAKAEKQPPVEAKVIEKKRSALEKDQPEASAEVVKMTLKKVEGQKAAPKDERPLPKEDKKEITPKPELKIVKDAEPAKAETPAAAAERLKKKGKRPVEVLMDEPAPTKKKAFIKKLVDKKDRREDKEREERPNKWRDEKKTAVAKMKKTLITVPKPIKRRLKIGEAITVAELAKRMSAKANEVINKLMGLGLMVTINQPIDYDAAVLIAHEFGYQVEQADYEFDESLQKAEGEIKNLKPRAPVVTIMGHVDHGKTSLLDAVRQTNIIDGEAGGITQAIGAYHVHIKDRDIVFLDTPGHEAFTAMRARGAKVTDIVVLVVAADDGVMEQTIEAINHSRVAGVPIIVAINKIDKPGADPGKIKQVLTEYNLVSEEWGGDTIMCEVSAKQKQGIEDLLEMILLQADIMELRADHDIPARGVVIEAKLDRGRGPVATVLIQEGTLREGAAFVSRTEAGRVRAMINDQGQRVKEAGPSMPVEVIGFSRVPQVGMEFVNIEDEKKARNIADYWIRKEREKELSRSSKITLEQLYEKIKEGVKDLNVIIKGDVQGSIEALTEALNKLSTSDIKLKIIHSSTGTVTETDVMLASASDAVIIGFNVRPDARVMELAEQEGVEIKLYDIIYNVIADVKAAMEGLLEPIYKEVVQGRAEVRELFKVPRVGTIAGSYVTDGKISRNAQLKLVRDGVVVYDGKIFSLKRFKDDVREVTFGFECGIGIENFNDVRPGDIIESYINEKIERTL
ncbi:MAG: translation initiation factor IF-2 [Deltaproteobacteria bacterium]|nr:translation initiation factor IF-2 [Deltaproteobacteria bacterium]